MWYNDYVGIPFLAKGREKTGVDCWGLVKLVYEEQFNTILPSFADHYEYDDTERIAELTAQYKEAWEVTIEPKPGSVILFKVLGHVSHVGIYIGNNNFLHCRENHSSAIESLDSINWNKRIAGYYNYAEKSNAVLNVVPHPLRTERWTVPVPQNTTVAELSTWVLEKFEISKELESSITIIRNGEVVPKQDYSTTVILDSDTIEYRAVPGKGFFRVLLIIAVVVASIYFGPEVGAALMPAGTSAATAAAVGGAVISTIGNLLIGYIMPIRPPSGGRDPGNAESQLLLSGASNQVSKYAAIPIVLGTVRMTPVLGGESYIDSNTDNSYLNMLLVWGFGPLRIKKSTLRIGSNSFDQYENGAGLPIEHYSLNDAFTADDSADIQNFNTLYGSDRQQVYSGITLPMHTTPTNVNVNEGDGFGAVGPWTTIALDQTNTNKIDVNFHFPQGLRQLRVSGKHAGDIYDLEIKFQVQIRAVNKFGVEQGSWSDKMRVTYPATTVIADKAYDATGTAKYQWTRIGVGASGIQVKVGPLCNAQYDTYGTGGGGYPYFLPGIAANVNIGVRLPAWPAGVYPLADVCMYGNVYIGTDNSVKSGALSGFDITASDIAGFNYSTANWANPTAGANTGDKLINIATGTCVRSTDTVISLGTSTSGLFRQRKDAFSYTVSSAVAQLGDSGYYKVRARRLTDDNIDTSDLKNKNMHVIVLQTATATANNKPIKEGSPTWRLAKTALRIKANDQLNSRIEGVNGIVTTICKDWNGTNWSTPAPTNNPASLFLYILEHPANAYRVTATELETKINMSALATWWQFCADNGFTFNSVVSTQRSVLEILRDICAAGRASPAMVDGKWTVIIDNLKTDIVQHFTPHNSWGFESSKRLPKQPHALRVSYLNADADYQEDEVLIYNAGYAATADSLAGIKAAEIFEQISLPGITDYTTVVKHARWHLAQAALRPEMYTLNTDLEYLVCNRGDRVKVMHDVPLWGRASGRIDSRINTCVPTSITAVTGTATATVISKGYPLYVVGTSIIVAGSSIIGYNGTKTVTGCTATTVSWTDVTTGTATISNTGTFTTTAVTATGGTATATFANQGYIPYVVGSTITIAGVTPTGYNGNRIVTGCTATTVSWEESTTGTATVQGTVKGTLVPNISSTVCSVFQLDEDIPLVASTSYTLRVRSKTGGSNTWTVSTVATSGYYNTIKLTTSATAAQIDNNDLFMFGELSKESVDLLVLAIEPFGNQNAKVTLVDYAETLFTTNYVNGFTVPIYTNNITLPNKNLVQSILYKPIITSIISDETVMEQVSTGNFKINIKVGFTNPPNLPTKLGYIAAEIDAEGDNIDNWVATPSVPVGRQSITISGVDELKTYKIRLRYISEDGRTGPWQVAMIAPVSSTTWNSGVLTINTISRHSFSVGNAVYLYNAQGTSLNNIYTVDTISSKTSLTCILLQPTTGITTTATTTRAGTAVATYTDKNYTPYMLGTQILVSDAVPATYNGVSTITDCDSTSVSWSTGNLLTYTEDLRNTVEAGSTRPWSQYVDTDTLVTYETGVANSQGVNGVSKLQLATTISAQRQVGQTTTLLANNTIVNISVEAKAAELSTFQLILGSKVPDFIGVTFNLSTGIITTTTQSSVNRVLNSGIISLGNGWYRCWLSGSTGTGVAATGPTVQLPTTSGTIGQGIYLSRAQFGLGLYPSQYIPVLAATANVLPITATTQGTITPCVITTAITQAAGVAKATFASQKHLSFGVGSSITITGATPAGFNGTFVITASTPTTVSWTSATTGPATVQGTIVRTPNVGSWVTSSTNQANQDLITGQGLVSSKNNYLNTFLAENLQHIVIGKTSPPDTVTNFTVSPEYATGNLKFTWSANSEIDVQYYEVRTDVNFGVETNRIYLGSSPSCVAPATVLGVTKTYYIKAIDYSGNYSTTSATTSYTVVVPNAISATPTFSYNSTSLTDTNVIFNWVEPTGSAFVITKYQVTLVRPTTGTTVQIVTAPTWTTPANWLGSATITIKTIDILGNLSASSTPLTVNKTQPQSVGIVTQAVVGTSLVLTWPETTQGSVPVLGYEIRAVDSGWGTTGYLYNGSATTASIDLKGNAIAAVKNYYIKAYDADNQYSAAAVLITKTIAAPVNITGIITSSFADTSLTNATITLNWNPATPEFGLYGYELSYTTTGGVAVAQTINTTSITLQTGNVWTNPGIGTINFTIKVIDNLGLTNKSTGVIASVVKSAPGAVTNFTSKVIDNNVLLSWTSPVKTTLPIDHITIVKGSAYATGTSVGDKTGTFTIVFEQTGGDYTYWIVAVDTDNQISTPISLTATVAAPPDYVFNAEYKSIFAKIDTTVTNTTASSSNIKVRSTENMYAGMRIILTGTTFGGLTAEYYYVVAVIDNTTITISTSSALTPLFVASSTASGTMTLIDATGAEGINSNSLYDNNGVLMPVDTAATFTTHFASGTGRTWTGPSDQATYFPIFIQPGTSTGYYEEVYNYTKTLASSQITLSYTGTSFNTPTITPIISTAPAVAGGGVTVTNTASSTTVTSTGAGSGGLIVGNFITIPATTSGQTVRIISTSAGVSMVVYPAVVAANSGATFSYAGTWTNYTGTTALGTAFQYVKAKISVAQATRNAGLGTITAPGGTNTTVTVTGASGSLFTKTFKVGDVITIPNTAVGADYAIASITSDTVLAVTVPVGVTMPAYAIATTYAYKGTDLYKLTSMGVKLDAKQKTESGMVIAASTDSVGAIVNFTVPFIDVTSITLAGQGTTPITPVYNFFDTNTVGTYTVSGTTTCTINVTGHGLVASNQMAYITFTSGTAPTGRYLITLVNANQFTITLPTALTTSGAVSVYPNSMTVYAFTDAGARVASTSISWTVRGF